MAITQPIRGGSTRIYNVIQNFNKGIDKKTADDVATDSSFKELKNFYNASEGNLSKRPGVYDSHVVDFLKKLATDDYDETKYVIQTNRFGDTPETLKLRLKDLYNTVFLNIKKVGTETDGVKFTYQADKIIGFELLKNTFFLEAMQDFDNVLGGEISEDAHSNVIELSCILVSGGFYTSIKDNVESPKRHGLYVCRLNTKLTYATDHYNVDLEIDTVDSTMNPYKASDNTYKCRWDYFPDNYVEGNMSVLPAKSVDISSYNGISYIATGSNYLIKIEHNPETRTNSSTYTGESNIIIQIGGYNSDNLYEPTPIEVNQIGFNVLYADPLKHYKVAGSTVKIRGVFYSVDVTKNGETFSQPVLDVPFNGPFHIHVMYTGTGTPETPKVRLNNGEVDIQKNPYKELKGSWDTAKKIFTCEGLDSNQKFELYIKLGDDEFRSFFSTTSTPINETGYVNEIHKAIFSSTHSKIIGNQLVLYGGHGYVFFSEYDVFNFFPNYNFLYIASEAGEEAVTGIAYFRQYYAIFTNKRIKRMTGTFGADDFGIYPLSDFVGCPNGRTIRSIGNNLYFLGNDGIYKLKQGYLGEGTENVEKIDDILNGALNLNNVLQAFVINNNYVVVKNDGKTWIVYNVLTEAFYEYNLESSQSPIYKGESLDVINEHTLPFYSIFQTSLYDEHGDFLMVPMYNYSYNTDYTNFTRNGTKIMVFRFNELDFLDVELRHKDGGAFISEFETHYMSMGYPTHTKKFKEVYIKTSNDSGHAIPLYVTVIVDSITVLSPEDYVVKYNEENDTYYYVKKIDANKKIDISKVLGEFVLGYDALGNKTIQQLKIKVGGKGRSIKLIVSDGYDDYTALVAGVAPTKGECVRNRNPYNFSVLTLGIVFKLKKVKEG